MEVSDGLLGYRSKRQIHVCHMYRHLIASAVRTRGVNISCPYTPGEVPALGLLYILINILCESPISTCNKMLSFYILNDLFLNLFELKEPTITA